MAIEWGVCLTRLLVFSYAVFIDKVVCEYRWTCTEPNKNGQRYIPSVKDHNVPTATSLGNALFIYRISNLNASCYGPVTAIEYCYRYSSNAGSGQATFNWTVLILEDIGSNNFVIKYTYVIQSRGSMDSASCTSNGDQVTCCDVTSIKPFHLLTNLTFGVIESAQGNTHEATLLGFHDSLSQYRVSMIILSRDGLNDLPIGSVLDVPDISMYQRGLRMLWFAIGIPSTEAPPGPNTVITKIRSTTSSPVISTPDASPMSSEAATDSRSTTMIDTDSLVSTVTANAATGPGGVVGAVTGSISLLFLALLLLLALVWMLKKRKRAVAQYNLNHQQSKQREMVNQQQHQGEEAIDTNSNNSYIPTRQISTEDNVAYGQATPQITLVDNVAYDQATPQIFTAEYMAYGQVTPQIIAEDNVAQCYCEIV